VAASSKPPNHSGSAATRNRTGCTGAAAGTTVADRWIVIPNWDRFQHYKDRDPTWIKVYTRLGSDPYWDELTLGQKGLLLEIWIMYARSGRKVTLKAVAKQAGRSYKASAVKALADAGFIELAASPDKTELRSEDKELETDGSAKKSPVDNHVVDKLAGEIKDANDITVSILHNLEQTLPDAAFATALESLRKRRTKKPVLGSEARYVVASLKKMQDEA